MSTSTSSRYRGAGGDSYGADISIYKCLRASDAKCSFGRKLGWIWPQVSPQARRADLSEVSMCSHALNVSSMGAVGWALGMSVMS